MGTVTISNENHIFEKMGMSDARSKEELEKYLPGSLIKKLEKTFLGKRISRTEDGANKRQKTALWTEEIF